MKQLLLAIISLLILATTANVYAGGPRLDWPEDSSDEGKDCWVEGYDAGFAGKYDKERADRCAQENDEYNRSWGYACIDGGLTKLDCDQIKDNPTNLENESLKEENTSGCFNDGLDDGKAHRPFNKDRASACSEYGSQYEIAYQTGCESDSTEESCELIIEGEEWYVLIIQIVQVVWNSYMMLAIKDQLKVEVVRGWEIQVHLLSVLKKQIQKDTVSTLMIQPFVKQLEIFVMHMVL